MKPGTARMGPLMQVFLTGMTQTQRAFGNVFLPFHFQLAKRAAGSFVCLEENCSRYSWIFCTASDHDRGIKILFLNFEASPISRPQQSHHFRHFSPRISRVECGGFAVANNDNHTLARAAISSQYRSFFSSPASYSQTEGRMNIFQRSWGTFATRVIPVSPSLSLLSGKGGYGLRSH